MTLVAGSRPKELRGHDVSASVREAQPVEQEGSGRDRGQTERNLRCGVPLVCLTTSLYRIARRVLLFEDKAISGPRRIGLD